MNATDREYTIDELRLIGQPWILHRCPGRGGDSPSIDCDGCGEAASVILPTVALCGVCLARQPRDLVLDPLTRRERGEAWEREALAAEENGVAVRRTAQLDVLLAEVRR